MSIKTVDRDNYESWHDLPGLRVKIDGGGPFGNPKTSGTPEDQAEYYDGFFNLRLNEPGLNEMKKAMESLERVVANRLKHGKNVLIVCSTNYGTSIQRWLEDVVRRKSDEYE